MPNTLPTDYYKKAVRLLFIAASLVLALWFSYQVITVIFLIFLAIVLTLILNAPTMWLVKKKLPRTGAALLVFSTMILFIILIGWLVVPRILEQLSALITNLPNYFTDLQRELAALLKDYPGLQKNVLDTEALQQNLPSFEKVVIRVGRFSFSIIGGIFLLILFFSIVAYMLINPAPLIETYLLLFAKEKRAKAAKALAKSSEMMVGWMWANFVIGVIEAIAIFAFLTYMDVPGVWVWAGLALFAEMIPRLGLYIMAAPPVIIALTISPLTALWVLVFYLALSEIMGDFVMPRIRAKAMNLHPVSSLLVMLLIGGAFGVIGALIATPITAFVKAYFETFYVSSASKENISEQVEVVLNRDID